jgi:hypothetical protein
MKCSIFCYLIASVTGWKAPDLFSIARTLMQRVPLFLEELLGDLTIGLNRAVIAFKVERLTASLQGWVI